jgi:uncharacterized membrane protein YqjE
MVAVANIGVKSNDYFLSFVIIHLKVLVVGLKLSKSTLLQLLNNSMLIIKSIFFILFSFHKRLM